MKIWDLGGQAQYRQEWGKFLRGADAIIYVLDAANRESVGLAKRELHSTLDDPAVAGIPLLIIGNKTDIAGHMSEKEIIEGRIAINEKDLIWTIYSVIIGLWLWPVL